MHAAWAQRLMVMGLFCLLLGVRPRDVNLDRKSSSDRRRIRRRADDLKARLTDRTWL